MKKKFQQGAIQLLIIGMGFPLLYAMDKSSKASDAQTLGQSKALDTQQSSQQRSGQEARSAASEKSTSKTFLQTIKDFFKPTPKQAVAQEPVKKSESVTVQSQPKPWQQKPRADQMQAAFGKYAPGKDVTPVPEKAVSMDEQRARMAVRSQALDDAKAQSISREAERIDQENKAPARPSISSEAAEKVLTERKIAESRAWIAQKIAAEKAEEERLMTQVKNLSTQDRASYLKIIRDAEASASAEKREGLRQYSDDEKIAAIMDAQNKITAAAQKAKKAAEQKSVLDSPQRPTTPAPDKPVFGGQ